jgi:hypothetical protein
MVPADKAVVTVTLREVFPEGLVVDKLMLPEVVQVM